MACNFHNLKYEVARFIVSLNEDHRSYTLSSHSVLIQDDDGYQDEITKLWGGEKREKRWEVKGSTNSVVKMATCGHDVIDNTSHLHLHSVRVHLPAEAEMGDGPMASGRCGLRALHLVHQRTSVRCSGKVLRSTYRAGVK